MKLVVAALLLSTAFAFAGCGGKASVSYPEAYLLRAEEIPAGLELADTSKMEAPFKNYDNPTEVPAFLVGAVFEQFQEYAPDNAWAEILTAKGSSTEEEFGASIIVVAAQWKDGTKIDKAVDELSQSGSEDELCTQENVRVFRDGNVLVGIVGDSAEGFVSPIVSKLRMAAPGLRDICE